MSKNFISVCKNVIYANNKRNWRKPDQAIRVSRTKSGQVIARAHTLAIKDKAGNIVARVVSTQDGKPVIKCGAKVAIITEYETEVIE
jgi:ribosomal protein L15E